MPPIKIVIAEDEALTALALEMELKKAGYEVPGNFTAGEQVLEFFEKNQADLVLMDLSLAGSINGIEAAGRLLEKVQVPVIIISGYPDHLVEEALHKVPEARFIPKPVDSVRLFQLIESLAPSSPR